MSEIIQGSTRITRLADCHFVDLYLSTDPGAPALVRGLRPRQDRHRPASSGLAVLPETFTFELHGLIRKLQDVWWSSGHQREFTLEHEGVLYRCSLMEAPYQVTERATPGRMSSIQNWALRALSGDVPDLGRLGLPVSLVSEIEAFRGERGLFIIAGPFGSGKTTTASALFDAWVKAARDVGVTLEDPPEFPMAKLTDDQGAIYQIDVTGKSFPEAVRYLRRWAPRFVFLGEIRTPEAAAEALHLAISGPLVLCTLHAADAVQSLVSLARFAAQQMSERAAFDMISGSCLAVLHQDLQNGHLKTVFARTSGRENFAIRTKIETGQFQKLHEEFDRQRAQRGQMIGGKSPQ
jgi:Tfp pilus assembly ATPase PilU